ncbi:MAG: hypothetical protein WBB25_12035 [Sulfitobacter sp.]
MRMKTAFKNCIDWLRMDFMRREDGTVAVEAMIVMPAMFWAYLAMFAIQDAYRTFGIHQKAAFSIGDAISRETVPLDDAYLTGVRELFEYLAHSRDKTDMRISQIWYDGAAHEYKRDWSQVRGSIAPLSDAEVKTWHSKLPKMASNERVVLFETWSNYDPPFETGLTVDEIRTFVFTRPRYAPVVCYNSCN